MNNRKDNKTVKPVIHNTSYIFSGVFPTYLPIIQSVFYISKPKNYLSFSFRVLKKTPLIADTKYNFRSRK